jgi:hypothetical protein
MSDTTFLIALVGAILGAASLVLHVVAPRTKNTIDDALRDDIDDLRAFVRTQTSAPKRGSEAGFARMDLVFAIPAMLILAAGVWACASTLRSAATGTVAILDCEAANLNAQDLADATKLAEAEVQHWLAAGAAASTAAIKADLAPFKTDLSKCALAGALAAATSALTPSSQPGVAAQGLTDADPGQLRVSFSASARQLGWPSVRLAGGPTL